MRVTVFGLGEAGSIIATDLARAGADAHGYDPADVLTPELITRHDDPGRAADDSTLVVAVTAAADAQSAITQALERIPDRAIYADLSTATPELKADLGEIAGARGLAFADVALMGTVPGSGLATPALASGPGATGYAAIVNEMGGAVEVLGDRPGDAASRKLLRSVVTKGLTSVVLEGLRAAEAHGSTDWFWPHLVELITAADETLLRRFLSGTSEHARRRVVEMESAAAFLESLGVPSTMTSATVDSLRGIEPDETSEPIIDITDRLRLHDG